MENIEMPVPLHTKYDNYRNVLNKLERVSYAKEMPLQGYRTFGCMNCDFRGTPLCDYGIPTGTGHSFSKFGINFDTICEKRYWYVLSIYSGTSKNPTYRELVHDYNRSLIQDMVSDLKNRMNIVQNKISAYETYLEEQNYKPEDPRYQDIAIRIESLNGELNGLRGHFLTIITSHEKLSQKDYEIEERSKDQRENRKLITLADIQLFMKPPEVIDVNDKDEQ